MPQWPIFSPAALHPKPARRRTRETLVRILRNGATPRSQLSSKAVIHDVHSTQGSGSAAVQEELGIHRTGNCTSPESHR